MSESKVFPVRINRNCGGEAMNRGKSLELWPRIVDSSDFFTQVNIWLGGIHGLDLL